MPTNIPTTVTHEQSGKTWCAELRADGYWVERNEGDIHEDEGPVGPYSLERLVELGLVPDVYRHTEMSALLGLGWVEGWSGF